MKASLAAVALLTMAAAPLAAQKPDFSGNWKVNAEKSDPMGPPGGGQRPPADPNAPRPAGGMGGMRVTEVFITQTDTKLVIDQKMGEMSRTLTYALDGSASKNPGMRGMEMVTKSSWVDNSIVTEGENTFSTPNGEVTIKTKETRTLSADGKTMTVVLISNGPRGEMTRKTVFDKQ